MTTALDLFDRGVRFYRDDARPRVTAPTPELRAEVRAEVERRIALFAPLLPARRPFVPVRIVPGERPAGRTAYYGACEHCDEPLSPHRAGACPLCEVALATAIKRRNEHGSETLAAPARDDQPPRVLAAALVV